MTPLILLAVLTLGQGNSPEGLTRRTVDYDGLGAWRQFDAHDVKWIAPNWLRQRAYH